jgi:hypothetical protein
VSPACLRRYLDEYAWRHNAEREQGALFRHLLEGATRRTLCSDAR